LQLTPSNSITSLEIKQICKGRSMNSSVSSKD